MKMPAQLPDFWLPGIYIFKKKMVILKEKRIRLFQSGYLHQRWCKGNDGGMKPWIKKDA